MERKRKQRPVNFEEACEIIFNKEGRRVGQYDLIGKGKDPSVTLKPRFSTIARKYLFFDRNKYGRVYPLDQVGRACDLADLYLTDVISKTPYA